MKMTAEEYARRVKQVGPRSPLGSDCLWAFCVGGGICLLGEVLRELLLTAAAGIVAYLVLTGLALFLKAEAATWPKPEGRSP